MVSSLQAFLLTFLVSSIGVCQGRTGPIVVGQTFIADSVDPRTGRSPWALVSHGIAEKLFTVNEKDEVIPQIAESVTKIDEDGKIWEVKIKSNILFSDSTPVDAQHVAFALSEQNKNNGNAQSSLGAMVVTVPSDSTVRIESERPTPVMDSVLAEWVFVIYYIKEDSQFIYSGPYMVDHFEENDRFDLIPNPYYDRASERPKVSIQIYSDGHELAKGMKANEVDVAMHLPIDTLQEIRDLDGTHVRTFEVGYHYMTFYNLDPNSPTSDMNVRKAIDMVIDRDALSQALAGGRGTRSFFPDFSPYFIDVSDSHGKEQEARDLLEQAGWVLQDGKRFKDGNELIIDLIAYPHRPGLVIMQPIIQDQLEKIGITVRPLLTGMDWSETSAIIDAQDFDMLMWAQHTLPAGDPAWFLSAFFRSDGTNNYGGFSSGSVDLLIDNLSIADNHEERITASNLIHDRITAELPMSNLVTPAWHVGLSERVVNEYEPWGSDYYVVRSDTFLGVDDSVPDSGVVSAVVMSTVATMIAPVALYMWMVF